MCERLAVPQPAALLQRLLDFRVRIEHTQASDELDGIEKMASGSDRRVNFQTVLHACIEVVGPVPGRRVHDTGARIERHVVAEHRERGAVVQRMLEPEALELVALYSRERAIERPTNHLADGRCERLGDNDRPPLDVVCRVVELRMKRDGHVRRNGPRRRRPDQNRDVSALQLRDARRELADAVARQPELDVDRGRGMVLVLDLGFSQRRAAMDAPVHWLLAFVDEPLLDEFSQRARNRRLISEIHRQIGIRPVAENPQALELRGHCADEPLGVRATRAAEFGDRHVALLRAELAVDLQLDWQPVAVVAWLVGRVIAGHRPRLDDEILEHLVQSRAHVDVAVRVGRTVVQDELFFTLAARFDLSVQIHGGPPRERLRLARRQVRLHRKVGARQVDGVFPLRHRVPNNFIMNRWPLPYRLGRRCRSMPSRSTTA